MTTGSNWTQTRDELVDALVRHPAVKAAGAPSDATKVFVVPDPDEAPFLHRAGQIEESGRLDGLEWHEPAADLLVAQVNRTETDFLYQEVYVSRAYLRHGIVVPDGATVVDVGANIGIATVFVAGYCHDAHVVAVEPVDELARAVALNAELHDVNATVLNCALGAEEGTTEFTYYPGNTVMSGAYADVAEDRSVLRNYLLTGEGAEAGPQLDAMVADRMTGEHRTCPLRTLTSVVESEAIERIDLLKIDVEKSESDVLAGVDAATWSRVQQVVVEVHDVDGRLGQLIDLLRQRGFDVVQDRDRRLELTPCFTLYGRRPGAALAPGRPRPAPTWPTRGALRAELLSWLAARCPALAAPATIVFAPSVPEAVASETPRALPDTPAAKALVDVWSALFGEGAVRADADFFELGGDSLTGVRLLTQVEARLGEGVLAPDTLFTTSRLSELVSAVEAGVASREP